jgi:hypothetical protein
VSRASVVTRLAVRELWITYRLLGLLVAFIAVGAAVALLPAPLTATMQRLAAGLGMATLVAGAIAAWSLADERTSGRAGWLVTRSVPRTTLLGGWFAALAAATLTGVAAAAILGWLAASGVALRLDPGGFIALAAAVAGTALAVVALGMLLGVLLRPRPAAFAALVLAASVGALAWLGPDLAGMVPGAALVALARLNESVAPFGVALRSAGSALLTTALMLLLARIALGRAEL